MAKPTQSLLDDLNDNCFVLATDHLTDLCRQMEDEAGRKPTIDDLCGLLTWGLRSMPDDALADINPANVQSLSAKVSNRKKIVAQPGDVVAVPATGGGYYLAVFITANRVGWAFGIFKGRHKSKRLSDATAVESLPHPIYTGRRFVASGRWPVIAHRPDLLARFPAEPEAYFRKADHPDDDQIGKYGSGETASGKLRDLTKREAEELGLLTGEYSRSVLEEEFESLLAEMLG